MTWQDGINGGFEALAGMLQLVNCRRLWIDRQVRGVDWRVTGFFAAWGIWNLFFYPHLDQWLSFLGGLVIVAANLLWVAMALRFTR